MQITKIWYSIQVLGVIALAILMAGCGGDGASPIPSSTLPSGALSSHLAGSWTGCIDLKPVEHIQMKINKVSPQGTFSGTYSERTVTTTSGSTSGIVANNAPLYSTQTDDSNNVQFSVDTASVSNAGGTPASVKFTYTFKGVLLDKATMKGQVNEAPRVGFSQELDWFLSNDGSACPW